jgi:hypothetical protein
MLHDTIMKITEELNRYKDLTPNQLFTQCINEKLKCTLLKYKVELQQSEEYLIKRKTCDVLKAITKIQKKQDKEDLQKAIQEGDQNNVECD